MYDFDLNMILVKAVPNRQAATITSAWEELFGGKPEDHEWRIVYSQEEDIGNMYKEEEEAKEMVEEGEEDAAEHDAGTSE